MAPVFTSLLLEPVSYTNIPLPDLRPKIQMHIKVTSSDIIPIILLCDQKPTEKTSFNHISKNVHISTLEAFSENFCEINADMSSDVDTDFIGQSSCANGETKLLR